MKIDEMNQRSRQIFREIVENYLSTGEPTGSRTLAKNSSVGLSPASIRNVMADLEDAGLLHAPHTSAGRLPTERGLRLFVDGLLEVGNLTGEERAAIEGRCGAAGHHVEDVLAEATTMLSGLSSCAGLVFAPRLEAPLRQIEFVHLGPGKALVVIVCQDGSVENRVIDVPLGLPAATLIQAGNYLSARLVGRTFEEAQREILDEINRHQAEIDAAASQLIEAGLASWAGGGHDMLIVRGQSRLLSELNAMEDLERVRQLLDDLENKRELARLLELARDAEGVRIFIGSENTLFSLSGSSLIVTPYSNSQEKIIGVIGVIGPTRLNYARVIPMVDYTAQVVGRLLG
jgi:heat-inducible transcriptional repressor